MGNSIDETEQTDIHTCIQTLDKETTNVVKTNPCLHTMDLVQAGRSLKNVENLEGKHILAVGQAKHARLESTIFP